MSSLLGLMAWERLVNTHHDYKEYQGGPGGLTLAAEDNDHLLRAMDAAHEDLFDVCRPARAREDERVAVAEVVPQVVRERNNRGAVDFDDDPAGVNERLPALDDAVLLFPSETPAPWPTTPPSTLVVIDGTWRQTRRMFTKLPRLHGLPRVQLDGPPATTLRLRDTSFEQGRSTLEAIAEALGRLEGPAVQEPLLRLHADFVERVLKARGVFEQKRDAFEKRRWHPL